MQIYTCTFVYLKYTSFAVAYMSLSAQAQSQSLKLANTHTQHIGAVRTILVI